MTSDNAAVRESMAYVFARLERIRATLDQAPSDSAPAKKMNPPRDWRRQPV